MNKIKMLVISMFALIAVSCGDMYDSARKSVLNDLLPVDLPVYYLYSANYTDNTVYSFRMQHDGNLQFVGSYGDAYIGTNGSHKPHFILAHPVYNSLYLSATDLTSTGWILTFGSDFFGGIPAGGYSGYMPSAESMSGRIRLHPSMKYLHAIYGIYIYTFPISYGGALQAPSITNFSGNFADIAVHPNGKYLYAIDNANIYYFSIDQYSGTLKFEKALPTVGSLTKMAIHPSGTFMYVARPLNIYKFPIDLLTGAVSNGTMLFNAPGDNTPCEIILHPSGGFIFLAYDVMNRIHMYKLNESGDCAGTGTGYECTRSTSGIPYQIVLHPSGDLLYAATDSNSIEVYRIDYINCMLTLQSRVNSVGVNPHSITIANRPIPFVMKK
ncbi:MAG: lactonase family protein [Spirochaetes bacterium]|jgi:6-phosphogluconolactonase (cycloisomerase 2 family)|nr:lactonase family protein [Spirochaetota bacterium]